MTNEYKAQVDFTREGGLAEQLDFIKNNKTQGGLSGFISVQGFLRSIRDIGYKSVGRSLNELVDKEFFIGNVKLKGHDLCSPCKYLQEKLKQNNFIKEFLRKGGLRCEILTDGKINVGDTIKLIYD